MAVDSLNYLKLSGLQCRKTSNLWMLYRCFCELRQCCSLFLPECHAILPQFYQAKNLGLLIDDGSYFTLSLTVLDGLLLGM